MTDVSQPRRRFTRGAGDEALGGGVPASVLDDPLLQAAIATLLPANYNFEIPKTVHQVRKYGATCVALQMPEGLTMYATAICDIIERYAVFLTQVYRRYCGDHGRRYVWRVLCRRLHGHGAWM